MRRRKLTRLELLTLLAPTSTLLRAAIYEVVGVVWKPTPFIQLCLPNEYMNYSLRTIQRELERLENMGLVKSKWASTNHTRVWSLR